MQSFGKLMFWCMLFITLGCSVKVFSGRDAGVSIGVLLCIVLPCAATAALLFIRFYLPGIADRIGFGFLFPRNYLEKAPLVLSPFHHLLIQEKYEEGYQTLSPLIKQHPGNPDLIYLFAQFCIGCGRTEEGLSVMECFFSGDRREKSDVYAKLLFYYADQCMKYKHMNKLCAILRNEGHSSFYTEVEKNAIKIRLEAMEGYGK